MKKYLNQNLIRHGSVSNTITRAAPQKNYEMLGIRRYVANESKDDANGGERDLHERDQNDSWTKRDARHDHLRPSGFDTALQVAALELEHHTAKSKQSHHEKE